MNFDIRPARLDEMDQFGLMGAYSYAGAFGDGPDNIVASSQKPEWTLCAFDGDTMATSFAAFPFTIRANGQTMGYAGITAVGTRPEYRRRGLLRKIMTQAFADQRERGQSVAGLWASQAAIYRRYGFAPMGANRTYRVDTVDLNLMTPSTIEANQVRRYQGADALPVMKDIYRTFAADRFGYLHRGSPIWLNTILGETPESGPLWSVVVSHNDIPAAYAIYSLRDHKVNHAARGQEIIIRDLAWTNINAYKACWEYLAAHDLVGRIVWSNAPVGDPLAELIHEPRMLHAQNNEGTWFRVVDAPSALTTRGYDIEAELNIRLTADNLTPWNDGTWQLQTAADGSHIAASNKNPDLTLSAAALSAAFSGTQRVSDLRHWGLVDCDVATAKLADQVFQTRHAAHCPDHY